jgi:Family of unknown function (DUF6263)
MIRYFIYSCGWLLSLAGCKPVHEIRLNAASLRSGQQFNYETLTQTQTQTSNTLTRENETRFATYTFISSHADGSTNWQYRYTRIKKTVETNDIITRIDTDSLPQATLPADLFISAAIGHPMTFSLSPNGTISQFNGTGPMWERITTTTTDPQIKALLPLLSRQFNDQVYAEIQAQFYNYYTAKFRRKKSKWISKGRLPLYHVPVETEFRLIETIPNYQVQVKRKIIGTQSGNMDIGLIKSEVTLAGDGYGLIALDQNSKLLRQYEMQSALEGTIMVKVPFGQPVTSPISIKIKETHRLTD